MPADMEINNHSTAPEGKKTARSPKVLQTDQSDVMCSQIDGKANEGAHLLHPRAKWRPQQTASRVSQGLELLKPNSEDHQAIENGFQQKKMHRSVLILLNFSSVSTQYGGRSFFSQ